MSDELVGVSSEVEATYFNTISDSFDAKAGPIWNNNDAKIKCPSTCASYSSQWNGQETFEYPQQQDLEQTYPEY